MAFNVNSTVKFHDGHTIPLLGFGMLENPEPEAAILEAFKAGYRHIDGAQFYKNEKEIGEAIRKSGVPREEIFVTSKLMPGTEGYEATAAKVDESLANFGFTYLDLYLVHEPLSGPGKRMPKYQAVLDAQKAGKVRSVGVSNYGVKHLQEIKDAGLPLPVVNQIELHPLNQQKPIVDWCKANGVIVEAYCPLLKGKFDEPIIGELAKKYNREPAQILLRWSVQKGFVPLPKSNTPARIHSNTKIFDFELSSEDMAALDALDKGKAGSLMWDPVDAE